MTSLEKITDRSKFIKFIRNLREIKVTQARKILGIGRTSLFYYENGTIEMSDKIFDKVVECYAITDRDIEFYLAYHGENEN